MTELSHDMYPWVCNPPSLVRRYPKNERGRDFIIGDLHGCLPLLQRLLDHVNFDPGTDRVFSTGDIVDRGPDVAGCLELLNQAWFHAVMGNHEWILIKYLEARKRDSRSDETLNTLEHMLINGGEWALFYEDDTGKDLYDWLPALKRLPMISSVGTINDSDRFHITHGDLLLEHYEMLTDEQIDNIEESGDSMINRDIFEDWHACEVMSRAIWSRRLFHSPGHYESIKKLKQLSLVYAGHTLSLQPRMVASHLFIDGGSFLAYRKVDNQNKYGLHMMTHEQISFWANEDSIVESSI